MVVFIRELSGGTEMASTMPWTWRALNPIVEGLIDTASAVNT